MNDAAPQMVNERLISTRNPVRQRHRTGFPSQEEDGPSLRQGPNADWTRRVEGGVNQAAMIPCPIETAPKPELDHEPVPILLYCPDRGGWHTGVW